MIKKWVFWGMVLVFCLCSIRSYSETLNLLEIKNLGKEVPEASKVDLKMAKYEVKTPWTMEVYLSGKKALYGLGCICFGGNTESTQFAKYGPATNFTPLLLKEMEDGSKLLSWDAKDAKAEITIKQRALLLPDRIKMVTDYEVAKELPGNTAMGYWLFDERLTEILGREFEAVAESGEIVKGKIPDVIPTREIALVDKNLKSFKLQTPNGTIQYNLKMGQYSETGRKNTVSIVPGRGLYVNLWCEFVGKKVPAGYFNRIEQEIIFP